MAERKPFLLRMDPEVYAALQRWAADDLRSLNAQIEFVLRTALRQAGRLRPIEPPTPDVAPPAGETGAGGPPDEGASGVPPDAGDSNGQGG